MAQLRLKTQDAAFIIANGCLIKMISGLAIKWLPNETVKA